MLRPTHHRYHCLGVDTVPKTVTEAVAQLASSDLPFRCFQMGPQPTGHLLLHVPHDDITAVVTHFHSHPVKLADGSVVPVDVIGRAGDSWLSEPTRTGSGRLPDPLPPEAGRARCARGGPNS